MRLLSVLLFAQLQTTTAEDPAQVVRRVQHGLEGDSTAAMAARWRQTLTRAPNDRLSVLGLATIARLTYDYNAADQLYARIIGGSDRVSAFARLGVGLSLAARSRYEHADSALAQTIGAARSASATDVEAEALIALAQIRARTVSAVAARALLDTAALRISKLERRSPLAEQRHCVAAIIHVRLATPGAADSAERGIAMAKRAGFRDLEGGCWFVLAQEMERRGSFDSAIVLLRTRVEPLLRSARNRQLLSAALQWGGYLALRVGRYSAARQQLLAAVSEGEASGSSAVLAWAHLGLGNVAVDVGDAATATTKLREARSLFSSQGDRWGLAIALALEGRLQQLRGDAAAARVAYLQAIDSLRAIGNEYATLETYRALALIEQEEGKWDAAERWLREGDRVARGRDAPGWAAERPVNEAANAMGRGELRKADSMFSEALRGRTPDNMRGIFFFDVATQHAEALARRGDLDGVERRLREAAESFTTWRSQQGNDRQYRVALLQARKASGLSGPGVPYAIGALARNGRVAAAFRFAEERRSRDLIARIVERDAPATDESRGGGLGGVSVVTLDETIRALRDSTALIEFVTGRANESVTALVITRRGSQALVLAPLDSLAGDARRLSSLVASGTDAAGLAQRLGTALLGPVLAALPRDVNRLVLAPDGALHRVPFEVLRLADGRALLERFTISITPSATALVKLQQRARPRGAPTLVAFGDPAFEGSNTRSTAATEALGADFRAGFAAVGGLSRLPNSAREARDAARYFASADVRLGKDASEAVLRGVPLRSASVIHLATHALVDDQIAWRSALALAPGQGYDGFVGASDLASLDLGAELVILSGCRTAQGAVFTGEGVQGLTAPLLEAGARAVMATRWSIGDRDAAQMVERFYAALATGKSASDALRQAARDAMASGLAASVWGAFTLVGDPGVTLALRRR